MENRVKTAQIIVLCICMCRSGTSTCSPQRENTHSLFILLRDSSDLHDKALQSVRPFTSSPCDVYVLSDAWYSPSETPNYLATHLSSRLLRRPDTLTSRWCESVDEEADWTHLLKTDQKNCMVNYKKKLHKACCMCLVKFTA